MMTRYSIEESGIVPTTEGAGQLLVFVAPDDRERSILREEFQLDELDEGRRLRDHPVARRDCTSGL
jgi:hypothetical protein